jgi:hypothetical protein
MDDDRPLTANAQPGLVEAARPSLLRQAAARATAASTSRPE